MLVIGLVGKIGSGKDEVAKFLEEERDFLRIDMGDVSREITREYGREMTRENLQRSTKEYRAEHGKDALGKIVVKRIQKNGNERVVISAIRLPEDVMPLQAAFGTNVHVFEVTASAGVRFNRLKQRHTERDPQSRAAFEAQEKSEEALFPSKALAPFIEQKIDNAGTHAKLFWQVDRILAKFENRV